MYIASTLYCTIYLQQRLSQQWSADKLQEMIQHEENAVFNQVMLFVSRVIWLRCPLDFEGKCVGCLVCL